MTSRKSTSSSADHEAVLSFEYGDAQRAVRVENALRPEEGAIPGDRSAASIDREERTVSVCVAATDLVALRAGVTTWTSLVDVAEAADGVDG